MRPAGCTPLSWMENKFLAFSETLVRYRVHKSLTIFKLYRLGLTQCGKIFRFLNAQNGFYLPKR